MATNPLFPDSPLDTDAELLPTRNSPGGRVLYGEVAERRPAPKAVPVKQTTEGLLAAVQRELQDVKALLGLVILTQANPPITDHAAPMGLDKLLADKWVPFHKNTLTRRIRIELFCNWAVAGAGVKLARIVSGPDETVLDIMTESGTFGKAESKPVLLLPGETLYVRRWNPDAMFDPSLTAASVLRGRIFDAQNILGG